MDDLELMKSQEAQNIAKKLTEQYQLSKVVEMIKDNKIYFDHDKIKYRVRLLNSKEKDEYYEAISKKHSQLLKDENVLSEKMIIKKYREKGLIDINDLDEEIKKINANINEYRMKLGEELSGNANKEICEKYKSKIQELFVESYGIEIRKQNILFTSFEEQLRNFGTKYLAYLSVEKENPESEKEEYIKAFKTLDDFLVQEEELVGKIILYSKAIQSANN